MCGHSLEVNVTSSLDLYLSVAQIHLLQQVFKDNMVDLEASEKNTEVRTETQIQVQAATFSNNKQFECKLTNNY